MWLRHDNCKRVMDEVWNSDVAGSPMFVLSQKLKILKKELRAWIKNVFGNVHEKVKNALALVDSAQQNLNGLGQYQNCLDQEELAQKELLNALTVDEAFWKEKSRLRWHQSEDRNTIFFHKVTNIRQATKSMTLLKDGDNILTEPQEIANHVLSDYYGLYACPNNTSPNNLIQFVIPNMVSEENNLMLTIAPSSEEIKADVFANGEGAPGSEGLEVVFISLFGKLLVLMCVTGFLNSSHKIS
ncbi:PREDICTED: uncharacterized protein LOC109350493 [Lupinus angustifolius]|uniref:uncharacterized protein LOC109350493 n=1 Tax=Lupinus angustifolius TaxID=3871 RepID=UPI00092F5010|nr:PREDICTED: uncharacterized protein LOC109350493 [Lupinus angustifolius]